MKAKKQVERKLRRLWHDLYFKLAPADESGFAMTCKDATEKIDLKDRGLSLFTRFRLWLHLSLCQACANYHELSLALGKAVRDYAKTLGKPDGTQVDVERINDQLVKKYSKGS